MFYILFKKKKSQEKKIFRYIFTALKKFQRNLFYMFDYENSFSFTIREKTTKLSFTKSLIILLSLCERRKMANSNKKVEVILDDQTPNKWCVSLGEETYKRFISMTNPTVHKVFGDGSLFSPMLFGKFFDPSDAFPLWEFESDVLLSHLRSSNKSTVDWYHTDEGYILKAEILGKKN
jgi:hypothetical protein